MVNNFAFELSAWRFCKNSTWWRALAHPLCVGGLPRAWSPRRRQHRPLTRERTWLYCLGCRNLRPGRRLARGRPEIHLVTCQSVPMNAKSMVGYDGRHTETEDHDCWVFERMNFSIRWCVYGLDLLNWCFGKIGVWFLKIERKDGILK